MALVLLAGAWLTDVWIWCSVHVWVGSAWQKMERKTWNSIAVLDGGVVIGVRVESSGVCRLQSRVHQRDADRGVESVQ